MELVITGCCGPAGSTERPLMLIDAAYTNYKAFAERVGRLPGELRELLAVASVEGEAFTAEVLARVQEADTRTTIRRLSGELDKQHRLVTARGVKALAALGKLGIKCSIDKIPGASWRTANLVEKRLPLHLENFGGWLNYPCYYFYWAYKKGHLFNSSKSMNSCTTMVSSPDWS